MLASRLGVFDRRSRIDSPFVRKSYVDVYTSEAFVFEIRTENVEEFESTFWDPEHNTSCDSRTFAVEKELRALTPEELVKHAPKVQEARLKELTSWVKHKTGHPMLVQEYSAKTGLRPLPSRSVTEWKMKEGQMVIKDRLVLKGFAERNTHTLNTSSPTATRLGHRMILLLASILLAPV
jgi:hypothetical protein